jgi:hypothetical protein
MQFNFEAVRKVFARCIAHHVPAGDEEQAVIALEEEAAGVGERLLP